jgi:hypothetical protein
MQPAMEESSVVYITMQEKTSSSSSGRKRKLAGQNNCCIFGEREMGQKERAEKAERNFFPTHLTSKEREKAAEEEYDAGKPSLRMKNEEKHRLNARRHFIEAGCWSEETQQFVVCTECARKGAWKIYTGQVLIEISISMGRRICEQ